MKDQRSEARGREARLTAYREQVRRTFRFMSDEALRFQDARIPLHTSIDRQEIDREIERRLQCQDR